MQALGHLFVQAVHVFTESIQDASSGRDVEEGHGTREDMVKQLIVEPSGSLQRPHKEQDRLKDADNHCKWN